MLTGMSGERRRFHLLHDAAVAQLEIFGGQAGNRAVVIGHEHVDADDLDAGPGTWAAWPEPPRSRGMPRGAAGSLPNLRAHHTAGRPRARFQGLARYVQSGSALKAPWSSIPSDNGARLVLAVRPAEETGQRQRPGLTPPECGHRGAISRLGLLHAAVLFLHRSRIQEGEVAMAGALETVWRPRAIAGPRRIRPAGGAIVRGAARPLAVTHPGGAPPHLTRPQRVVARTAACRIRILGVPGSTSHATISRPSPRANAASPSESDSRNSDSLDEVGSPRRRTRLDQPGANISATRGSRTPGTSGRGPIAASTSRMAAPRCGNAAAALPDLRSHRPVIRVHHGCGVGDRHASMSTSRRPPFRASSINGRISPSVSRAVALQGGDASDGGSRRRAAGTVWQGRPAGGNWGPAPMVIKAAKHSTARFAGAVRRASRTVFSIATSLLPAAMDSSTKAPAPRRA